MEHIREEIKLWTLEATPENYKSILEWADDFNFLEEAKESIRNTADKQDAFYDVLCDCRDKWREQVLDISERRIITVLTATGGPAYGYDFEVNEEGEVVRARYWKQDWFEPKNYLYELDDEEADRMASYLGLTEFYY